MHISHTHWQAARANAQTKAYQRECLHNLDRNLKYFYPLFKKIKTPYTQTNQPMTVKLNNDDGLQGRWTERQHTTAVWRNGGYSASYDSFVVGSRADLRINICGENRHLRQGANRCVSY